MENRYLDEWIIQAEEVPAKVESLFSKITEEELNHKPNPEQWSIGELMDHIMVTNSLYFPKYQKIVEGNHRNPFSARFGYVTDFLGKSILQSVDPENPKKLKTVKKFEPVKSEFTLQKVEEFKSQQAALIDLVKQTDTVNHNKTYISSPAGPLIVYSLEYANRIILWHELRHIQQANDLLKKEVVEA